MSSIEQSLHTLLSADVHDSWAHWLDAFQPGCIWLKPRWRYHLGSQDGSRHSARSMLWTRLGKHIKSGQPIGKPENQRLGRRSQLCCWTWQSPNVPGTSAAMPWVLLPVSARLPSTSPHLALWWEPEPPRHPRRRWFNCPASRPPPIGPPLGNHTVAERLPTGAAHPLSFPKFICSGTARSIAAGSK